MNDYDEIKKQPRNEQRDSNEIERVYTEQVKLLYANAPAGMFANLVNSAILTFILWNVISHTVLITWFSCNFLVTLFRYILVYRYNCTPPEFFKIHIWDKWFTFGIACAGISWSLPGIILFPVSSIAHQVFIVFVLAGMIAGAMGLYSIMIRAFVVFAIPVSVPIIVRFFAIGGDIHIAMGGMTTLFMIIMLTISQRMHKTVIMSLKLQFENTDLITHLTAAKEHVENLNEELKSEIRGHKQAEEELRESEEKYRSLAEECPVSIMAFNRNGTVTFVNNWHLKTFARSKYGPEFFVGKKITELPGMVRAGVTHELESIFRGESLMLEDVFFPEFTGGHSGYVNIKAAPIFKDSEVNGGILIRDDVTERRRAEKALRESEERYSSLINDAIDSLQSGIIILDKDFRIDWMNRTICEFFGIEREKLIGADKRKAIRERIKYIFDTPDLFENRVLKTYKDNTYTENFECHVLPGDRREERFLVHWSTPILSGALKGGRVEHYYDITEIRRIRDQLLMAGKMEAVGTLAGGIAHDFNNLLQAIMGYTQMLLMDKERDNPDFDKLTQIESSAQRAGELTQQLLTFSRKVESKLRPVNINQEIKQVEKLLKRTIPRMIDIELHLEENIKVINADPAQVEQLLMNLGVNARDAMPDGGKVVVETENVTLDEEYCKTHLGAVPGEHVLLSFSDTGHGMDKETVEHIFEPFYTTKETGKGTGLGLAMVYGIVKSHDGYIMCYSEPGKGTTFKIYFPAIEESVVSGGLSVDREEEMPGGNETILLVDDEKAILDMGKNMLERFGYTVIKAESGEKAIEIYKAQKERIDLVILDLGMPGMGGHKCLKELLKIDSHVKVIIASGYPEIGKVKETVESGASGFIGKPYQLADMLKKVREALQVI